MREGPSTALEASESSSQEEESRKRYQGAMLHTCARRTIEFTADRHLSLTRGGSGGTACAGTGVYKPCLQTLEQNTMQRTALHSITTRNTPQQSLIQPLSWRKGCRLAADLPLGCQTGHGPEQHVVLLRGNAFDKLSSAQNFGQPACSKGASGAINWAILMELGMARPLMMCWITTQSMVNDGPQWQPTIGDTLLHCDS